MQAATRDLLQSADSFAEPATLQLWLDLWFHVTEERNFVALLKWTSHDLSYSLLTKSLSR